MTRREFRCAAVLVGAYCIGNHYTLGGRHVRLHGAGRQASIDDGAGWRNVTYVIAWRYLTDER